MLCMHIQLVPRSIFMSACMPPIYHTQGFHQHLDVGKTKPLGMKVHIPVCGIVRSIIHPPVTYHQRCHPSVDQGWNNLVFIYSRSLVITVIVKSKAWIRLGFAPIGLYSAMYCTGAHRTGDQWCHHRSNVMHIVSLFCALLPFECIERVSCICLSHVCVSKKSSVEKMDHVCTICDLCTCVMHCRMPFLYERLDVAAQIRPYHHPRRMESVWSLRILRISESFLRIVRTNHLFRQSD